MMISLNIKRSGNLAQALQERLAEYQNAPTLRAGFLETAKYLDGTPVATVAFWQEYGTKNIPARPFFRQTIAEKQKGWGALLGRAIVKTKDDTVVQNTIGDNTVDITHKGGVNAALALVGERIKDDITTSIRNFNDPANAPSTIAKKGFDKALIDRGIMQRSTNWDLEG